MRLRGLAAEKGLARLANHVTARLVDHSQQFLTRPAQNDFSVFLEIAELFLQLVAAWPVILSRPLKQFQLLARLDGDRGVLRLQLPNHILEDRRLNQHLQLRVFLDIGAFQHSHQQVLQALLHLFFIRWFGLAWRIVHKLCRAGMLENYLQQERPAELQETGAETDVKPDVVNAGDQLIGLDSGRVGVEGEGVLRLCRSGFGE